MSRCSIALGDVVGGLSDTLEAILAGGPLKWETSGKLDGWGKRPRHIGGYADEPAEF